MAKEQISRYQAFMEGLILKYKNTEKAADGTQRVVLKNTTSWSPHAYKTIIFTGHDIFVIPYLSAAEKIRIPLSNTFIGKLDDGQTSGAQKAENRDDLFAVLYKTPGAIQAKVTNIQDIIIFCGEGQDAIKTATGDSTPQGIAKAFGLDGLSAEMQKGMGDSSGRIKCGNMNIIFLDSATWAYEPNNRGIVCRVGGDNFHEREVRKKLIAEKLAYANKYTSGKPILMQTINPPVVDASKYSINSYIWECKNPNSMHRQEKKAAEGVFRDVCTITTGDIAGVKFGNLITYADVFKHISNIGQGKAGIKIVPVCQDNEYAQTFYASPSNYPFDRKLIEYISEYYFKPKALMAEIEKYADGAETQKKSQSGELSGTICSRENLTSELIKIAGSCLNTLLAITATVHKRGFRGFTLKDDAPASNQRTEAFLLRRITNSMPMPVNKKTPIATNSDEYADSVRDAVSMIVYIFMHKPRTKVDESGQTVSVPYDANMQAARELITNPQGSSKTTYLLEYLYSNAKRVIEQYSAVVKKSVSAVGEDAQFNAANVMTFPVRMLEGFTVEAAIMLFAQITMMYAILYESRAFYSLGMDEGYYISPSWQINRHNNWLGKGDEEIAPNSVVVDVKFIHRVQMLYGLYTKGKQGAQEIRNSSCWGLMFHDGVYRLQNSNNLLDSFSSDVMRGHRYLIERVMHNI